MSTFVLKRSYELQLPTSFVDVDREEMEYVDGGANWVSNWACSVETVGAGINLAVAGIIGGAASWVLAKKVATAVAVKMIDMGIGIGGLVITNIVYNFLKDTNFGLAMARWFDSRDGSINNGIVWF